MTADIQPLPITLATDPDIEPLKITLATDPDINPTPVSYMTPPDVNPLHVVFVSAGIPTFDALGAYSLFGYSGSVTVPITIGNVLNRYVLFHVHLVGGGNPVISATAGGVGMSLLRTYDGGTWRDSFFGLVAPAVGAINCVGSWAGFFYGIAHAISYYIVNQLTPYGSASDGALSNTLSSQIGRLCVGMFAIGEQNGGAGNTIALGVGETPRENTGAVLRGANNYSGCSIGEKAGALSVTQSVTVSPGWAGAPHRHMMLDLIPA